MITQPIKTLIESLSYVFVSTADKSGQPHVAIGEQVTILGDSLLIFENWFCPATLQNIAFNTHVSVVAVLPETGKGYQLLGSVIRSADALILDGCDSGTTKSAVHQVLTRFTVRVDKIFEFTSGIHTDMPILEYL